MLDYFEVVGIEGQDFAGAGVGDVDVARGGGDMGAAPKAGVDGAGEGVAAGGHKFAIVGVVQPHFAIAHYYDEQFAVIAEGDLNGAEGLSGRNQLLHCAVLDFDEVEADTGTEGKEMVETLVAENGGQAEVVRGAGRGGDEGIGEFAVVGFQSQDAAGAAEGRDVAVAGVAVELGAVVGGGVEDVAIHIPDVGGDGQAVLLRVGGEVRVLGSYGKEVVLERHGGAVVGAGVEAGRVVGSALGGQFLRVEQHYFTGAVVENGGPTVAEVEMHRPVSGQVDAHRLEFGFDQIEVAFVGFEVDAAVDDMDLVGVGGDGDGVAAVAEFVEAAGAGAHIVGVVGYGIFLEVDDGHSAGFAVADEQAAVDFGVFIAVVISHSFGVAVVMVGVGEGEFDQFAGFQAVGEDGPDGVAAGLFDYGVDFRGQAGAVAENDS